MRMLRGRRHPCHVVLGPICALPSTDTSTPPRTVHYVGYLAASGEVFMDTQKDTDSGEPAILVAGRGQLRRPARHDGGLTLAGRHACQRRGRARRRSRVCCGACHWQKGHMCVTRTPLPAVPPPGCSSPRLEPAGGGAAAGPRAHAQGGACGRVHHGPCLWLRQQGKAAGNCGACTTQPPATVAAAPRLLSRESRQPSSCPGPTLHPPVRRASSAAKLEVF